MPHYRPRNRLRTIAASPLRFLVAVLLGLTVLSAALPSDADLAEEIAELKEEREALQEQRESQARAIDVSTAEASEVAAALAALNGQVNEQQDRLEQAQVQLADAEERFADASQAVVNKSSEIESLKGQVSDRAISAFTDQNLGSTPVLENTTPNLAVRMQTLVDTVTRQEVDVTEQLRQAQADLSFEESVASTAADEAETFRQAISTELEVLNGVRDDQAVLLLEAEARLESQLAEQAVMAERDKEIAAGITERNEELERQAELARRNANPAPATSSSTGFPTADQVVKVEGFWVHEDIADNLQRMLDHAARDGITFGGWGYRDHQTQIRLRREHCGTSEWAIWQQPSSTCNPPTARPGRSQHELGKAIDFTFGGSVIGTHSSPGYKWLNANAANYGLFNLPSEPWHWSVNGR